MATNPRVTVWAQIRVPGLHRWPNAPEHRWYLRTSHRHLFHITAEVVVTHDERDVEFHDLHDHIRTWWKGNTTENLRDCGVASCETLAHDLAAYLTAHGLPVVRTEVSEDGEAGAIVRPNH